MGRRLILLVILICPFAASTAEPEWVQQSNRYSQLLLDVIARFNPEDAARLGIEGYDENILDLKSGYEERLEADLEAAVAKLEAAKNELTDAKVRQDLEILIAAARDQKNTSALRRRHLLPFFDLPGTLFQGFQDLLDTRVPKARYPAALVRLRRYVGRENGFEPITRTARARFEERGGNTQLLGPWVMEAQQYLDNQSRYMDGIEDLLQKSGLRGWQKDMQTLRKQVDAYGDWVRSTVLPRARKTNQLPAEIYADNLKLFGVKADPRELIERASASYAQTRTEAQALAHAIARERKWNVSDYRSVIRELKKERIPQEKLLIFYQQRLDVLEQIVRREQMVSLPTRKAVIRLATEAESAAQPAPHVDTPRLIGNQGESAVFVLPTRNPNAKLGAEMDDFSYDAIAWTLTAHEARPGHELQFAAMIEAGVSIARVVFAFNSANVEGWALYAEARMKQFMPVEGQLGVLQMRLLREARAFLDPMLNLGLIKPDAALRFLIDDTILSEPMAKQEVDRYTFRAPGQATSYFYGYHKLNALRTKVELTLANKFREQPYHDFIVHQGLLPFELLEKAVMEEFVAQTDTP